MLLQKLIKKLIQPKVDWKKALPTSRYHAVDKNGYAFFYSKYPLMGKEYWLNIFTNTVYAGDVRHGCWYRLWWRYSLQEMLEND